MKSVVWSDDNHSTLKGPMRKCLGETIVESIDVINGISDGSGKLSPNLIPFMNFEKSTDFIPIILISFKSFHNTAHKLCQN